MYVRLKGGEGAAEVPVLRGGAFIRNSGCRRCYARVCMVGVTSVSTHTSTKQTHVDNKEDTTRSLQMLAIESHGCCWKPQMLAEATDLFCTNIRSGKGSKAKALACLPPLLLIRTPAHAFSQLHTGTCSCASPSPAAALSSSDRSDRCRR